ncbi:MAG: hypothetical protein U0169_05610 [Polyangiaceae bacterium]
MRRFARALALGFGLAALSTGIAGKSAHAEADTFGLGRGQPGTTTLTGANVINAYAGITRFLAPGDNEILVNSSAGFSVGDAVLVWQPIGLFPRTSGTETTVDLSASPTGRYEFARIQSTTATSIRLTNPVLHTYGNLQSQVIRVPEYGNLTIAAGATVSPTPWDGVKGGVVAFLATGLVTNDGTITADAAGFRGGVTFANGGPDNCTAVDGTPANGFASKGEGLTLTGYSTNPSGANPVGGRGNLDVGAGGGDCHNSGGGGGGNASAGGKGGRTWTSSGSADVGGLGGAALTYSVLDHLTFGGGGGAGDQNGNGPAFDGGRGGGVIFFRAAALAGTGTISANGGTPGDTQNDAASGGGAGGTIAIRVATSATCTAPITARGGNGGNPNFITHGPGAGGGSGRVLLQALSSTCTIDTSTGVAGVQTDPMAIDGPHYGATPLANTPGTPETPPPGGFGPLDCAVGINNCGGCVSDSFCGGTMPVCRLATHTCACTSNTTCGASSTTPICDTGTGVCSPCNGNAGSGASHACEASAPFCNSGTGACGTACNVDADCGAGNFCNDITDAGVCTPKLANGTTVTGGACTTNLAQRVCVTGACDAIDNACGIPFDKGTCASTPQCRSGVCVTSGAFTGFCKACTANAQCTSTPATPVCSTTNTCVQCTGSNRTACTGTTPTCDTTASTCAACTGDFGVSTSRPCPQSTSPFCGTDGSCGKCTSNTDCVGHSGPVCNVGTGACGTVCFVDGDCTSTQWCAAGTCTPKTDNGVALPNTSPIGGVCSVANGTRVCASAVCEEADDRCGRTNGNACGNSAQCRSDVCTPADGLCGALNGTACTSPSTCRSNVCNADGYCGDPNGTACTSSTTCRSALCENGRCGSNCISDAQCAATSYCDGTTRTCLPDAPNGVRPGGQNCERAAQCLSAVCSIDGMCGQPDGTSCVASSVCRGASVCNGGTCTSTCANDAECATPFFCDGTTHVCVADFPNGDPQTGACNRGAQCASGLCAADGKCGARTGEACASVAQCRTDACSNGTCGSGCADDAECTSDRYCDTGTSTCLADAPNGGRPQGAACSRGAQCLSGACHSDGTCGKPNGEPCGDALVCRSAVCFATDTLCGLPDGRACTSATQCRSNACSAGICGTTDAGAGDGGMIADGSVPTDSGSTDGATATDSGTTDAGRDAGALADASTDATVPDSGVRDASTSSDGSIVPSDASVARDAETVADATTVDGATPNGTLLEGGGVTCSATPGPARGDGALVAGVFGLVAGIAVRRRRRRDVGQSKEG